MKEHDNLLGDLHQEEVVEQAKSKPHRVNFQTEILHNHLVCQ